MSSPSHSYPPQQKEPETLYSKSVHSPLDKKHSKRRSKYSQVTDPSKVTYCILILALLYWLLPIPSPFSIYKRSTRNSFPNNCCSQNSQLESIRMPGWQKTFTLSSRTKGCHLVTDEVMKEIGEGLKGVKVGILTLFIQHTSAALSLNENFDRTVRSDMDMALDSIVPESLPWDHTDEGPDDSASHTKASLIGPSVQVPISDGKLMTGTWQGFYLCEFRRMKHSRRIVATIMS